MISKHNPVRQPSPVRPMEKQNFLLGNDAYTAEPCAYTAEQARRRAQAKRIKLRYFIDPIIILLAIIFVFYMLGQMQTSDETYAQNDLAADCQTNNNNLIKCVNNRKFL